MYREGHRRSIRHVTLPFTIEVSYRDDAVGGKDEARLTLFYWDEAAAQWQVIPSTVDSAENQVIATVDQLTTFVVAEHVVLAQQLFLPLITR